MLLVVLVCSLSLAAPGRQVDAEQGEDDWIDPYDMINYDSSTKKMRQPAEPANYGIKREDPCCSKVVELQKQVEELQKTVPATSQQAACNPVFKRFLSRLLKKVQAVGLPSDDADVLCDAKIQLSKQAMTEIQKLLEGEDSVRTGALDNAVSQILVDIRPHNYEAWKWRFEDTFGVELDTILKMGLCVLVIMGIICTQLWSRVSSFVQFRRLFAVCFFVSIIWNWFYLYKIAFAEHQNNMVKLHSVSEKCTGMKKIEWSDSLKEWFRSTWTLQDDPCKKYYEVLMVNPMLLVPPTKAISVTLTTFVTEPLKHFGQGISEFLQALLKDLPVTLQIPVLLTIVLAIVVCMYASVQAAFQHGITAPFRRPRRDPPPPPLEQPQHHLPRIEDRDYLAEGDAGRDAQQHALRQRADAAGRDAQQHAPRQRADGDRYYRNQVQQRRPNRPREVETLRTAEPPYSEDEPDAERREAEPNLSAESDSENQPETPEELVGASASSVAANTAQSKTKSTKPDQSPLKTKSTKSDPSPSKTKSTKSDPSPSKNKSTKSDLSQSKNKPLKENEKPSQDEPSEDSAASLPAVIDFQGPPISAENRTSSLPLTHVETVGVPVQESSPELAEQTLRGD